MSSKEIIDKDGKKHTIRFASTERIEKYDELATEFFEKILGFDYGNCILTDLSSILDFSNMDAELIGKVMDIYKIDISDIEDGNFAEIFDRIALFHGDIYIM